MTKRKKPNKKYKSLSAFEFKEGNCIVTDYWEFVKLAITKKVKQLLFWRDK